MVLCNYKKNKTAEIWSFVKNYLHRRGHIFIVIVLFIIFVGLCLLLLCPEPENYDGKPGKYIAQQTWSQDNPEFIIYVREHVGEIITVPDLTKTNTSETMDNYDINNPKVFAGVIRSELIMKYIKYYLMETDADAKRIGFYVEIGTGNEPSTTIDLETVYKWRGLIIEPNKEAYKKLINTNRIVLIGNFCVSPKRRFTQMKKNEIEEKIDCYPLYTILSVLLLRTIDFMSIISGGTEIDIIKTLPINFFVIKVIYIDHRHIINGPIEVEKLMTYRDYHLAHAINVRGKIVGSIFVHNYLLHEEQVTVDQYDQITS